MMPNAPRFAHAGGADDDGGILQVVQLHRMRHFADVSQILHAERIFLFAQKFVDRSLKHSGCSRKTSVAFTLNGLSTKIGTRRQLSGQRQLVQRVDNLLRAADGESRDDDFPVSLQRFAAPAAPTCLVGVAFGACSRPP